jgi:Acetyltransferases, including N-acetylases of ribosomal proteins
MNGIGTRTIETQRLVLRRFIEDDAQSMYDNWAGDPEVTKYLRWAPHQSVEVTSGLLKSWLSSYDSPDRYHWAIVLKENNMLIGSISIMGVSELDDSGEIGYCMGKNWWGQGLMTEAAKAVIAFAFGQAGFHRLEAYHSVNNPASGRVMQKAGMVREGLSRQKYKCASGYQDCVLYAILQQDPAGA